MTPVAQLQVEDQHAAMVEEHVWVARHAARRFAGRSAASDDLFQVACLGLVKAARRFDPERGVRFATFAMPTVVGEIRRHFRDRTWALRVARSQKDLHLRLRAAMEELTHRLGRTPTTAELAEHLEVSTERLGEAMGAGANYQTLSISVGWDDSDSRGTVHAMKIPSVTDAEIDGTPERVMVRNALRSLPIRDRRAVHLRYYQGKTQAEIADELGVSQVHVSRILRSALTRLGEVVGAPPVAHEM